MTKKYRCRLRDEVLTKEVLTRELCELRKPLCQVAEEYGTTVITVSKHAAFHGVVPGFKTFPSKTLSKELMVEMYVNRQMSEIQIATELGVKSKSSISRALHKHGIRTRTQHPLTKKRKEWLETQKRGFNDISGVHWSQIKAGASRRNIDFAISIEYAWEIWLRQQGCCALTGILLTMQPKDGVPRTASLDRIESSKGYATGNIQWVHKELNRMKGSLDEVVFETWCERVCAHKQAKKNAAV